MQEKIKIRLEAYDHRILDKAVRDIVDTAKRTGARVAGPVPLPTRVEKFTVLRSPHVNKKSREQFEIRTHKRMIEILEPTAKTNEVFSKVDVPAGVDIKIKANRALRGTGRCQLPFGVQKVGMTQLFDGDQALPVTVIQVDPNEVVEVKTEEKHGYSALKVACGPR